MAQQDDKHKSEKDNKQPEADKKKQQVDKQKPKKASKQPEADKKKQQEEKQQHQTEKQQLKQEKQAEKERKKKEKLRKKRERIERNMSRPAWLKILIFMGTGILKVAFILTCFFVATVLGLMVGIGYIGDGDPSDALDINTWRNIYNLVFP